MVKPYISLLIVILLLAGGVFYYSNHKVEIQNLFVKKVAKIDSISLEKNNFVVRGEELGKVEIWVIPTGTEIPESSYGHLGDAVLSFKNEVGSEWTLAIPHDPLLITQVFAKGFDTRGNEIGSVVLPITGASALYDALWAQNNPASTPVPTSAPTPVVIETKTQELKLSPGQKATFAGLTLTFNKIIEDSRCPVDVQCIRAGDLQVSLSLVAANQKTTATLKDTDQPLIFSSYRIEILSTEPVRKAGVTPENTKYIIHFLVTKL